MKILKELSEFACLLAAVLLPLTPAAPLAQTLPTADQLSAMAPMDPAAVPRTGSFRFLIGPNPGHPSPPLPCPPGDLPGLPVYALGGNSYLLDDRGG